MTQSTSKAPRMTVRDLGALLELAAARMSEDDLASCALTAGRLGDRYTMVNRFAIFVQCPEAVEVHGFRAWRQHGRKVAKGQHGLGIFAPVTRREQARDEASPADGGKDAQPADELDSGGAARLSGYRIAYVWDISQTVPLGCSCPSLSECRCPRPFAEPPQGASADADEIRELLAQLAEHDENAES